MKDRIFLVHLNLIFFRIRLYSKTGLNEGLPRHIWVRKQQGKNKGWVNMKRRLLFLVRLRTHSMRLSSSCPLSPGGFQFVTVLAILFSLDTLFVKSQSLSYPLACVYLHKFLLWLWKGKISKAKDFEGYWSLEMSVIDDSYWHWQVNKLFIIF